VMAWFVEARDPYTGGHLWRVSRYVRLLADAEGLAPAEAATFALGGFLHDLGKIGVPDAVLRKPGALDEAELAVIRTHPDLGVRMLAGHPLAWLVRDAILHHHERYAGAGYPKGLAGPVIPEAGRMVAVCDAFDAMTSHRPYRAGLPVPEALRRVEAGRGEQFDPRWGGVLLELGRSGALEGIVGHADEGIPLLDCPACGPTLAPTRGHRHGDPLWCRNCGAGFILEGEGGNLRARPTGRNGEPADLEPAVDEALVAESVARWTRELPVARLVSRVVTA
ncbi:MAG: HD-GYP domain-containing protein, partial [Gammaproteobacteria bacterium]